MSVSVPRAGTVTPIEPVEGAPSIPPLQDGDRLTRDEFERRYDVMPQLRRAELIEGVVHVPSPVRQRHHSAPHSSLVGWLFLYRARTPGVELGDNLRSTAFPGLWLDPTALMSDDFETLLNVLQRGVDSPQHAEFAAQLRQARTEPAG